MIKLTQSIIDDADQILIRDHSDIVAPEFKGMLLKICQPHVKHNGFYSYTIGKKKVLVVNEQNAYYFDIVER